MRHKRLIVTMRVMIRLVCIFDCWGIMMALSVHFSGCLLLYL